MKNLIAVLLSVVSAFAFSFALDLLIGGLTGAYPSTAFLPVVTWSIVATVAGLAALRLAPANRLLVVPCLVFAALAFFGGAAGHRYSLIVGVGLLVQAIGVLIATYSGRPSRDEVGTP